MEKYEVIAQCRCYTTMLVNGKKHTVPTSELDWWEKYFDKSSE